MHHAFKLTQPDAASARRAGSWAKLRNIGVLVTAGQLQGVFTPMSKWARWPSDAGLAAAAASRYDSNVVAGAPHCLSFCWGFQDRDTCQESCAELK